MVIGEKFTCEVFLIPIILAGIKLVKKLIFLKCKIKVAFHQSGKMKCIHNYGNTC